MVVCPVCKGEKTEGISLWHGRDAFGNCVSGVKDAGKCAFCGGWGKVTPERMAMREKGQAMRRDRISRGLSVREEAKRLRVDPEYLSGVESGRNDARFIKPDGIEPAATIPAAQAPKEMNGHEQCE